MTAWALDQVWGRLIGLLFVVFFCRMLPYFNGLYNVEEMIYYEKLSRSELTMMLDMFKDILTITVHEDPNPIIRINVRIE